MGERLKVQTEGALTAYPWHRAKQERENHKLSRRGTPPGYWGSKSDWCCKERTSIAKKQFQSFRKKEKLLSHPKHPITRFLVQNIAESKNCWENPEIEKRSHLAKKTKTARRVSTKDARRPEEPKRRKVAIGGKQPPGGAPQCYRGDNQREILKVGNQGSEQH